MKCIYSIFSFILFLFFGAGCTTHRSIETEQEILSSTWVSDGYRLESVKLVPSSYSVDKEPQLSIKTSFSEYQHLVKEVKSWDREERRMKVLDFMYRNSDPWKAIFIPMELCLFFPANLLAGDGHYNTTTVTKYGPVHNVKTYTESEPSQKKYGSEGILPEIAVFTFPELNDFRLTMRYVDGTYTFAPRYNETFLKQDYLSVQYESEEEPRRLSLYPFHQAHQGFLNLKKAERDRIVAAKQQQERALKQQELDRQEATRKATAVAQHKREMAARLDAVNAAVKAEDWARAITLQKERIAHMQSSRDYTPPQSDVASAYEMLVEYASEAGDFDAITEAMKLHKQAVGN